LNSAGEENFTPQTSKTLGAVNAGPRIGPVVISEIHYHPLDLKSEFIEIANLSDAPVPLFDPMAPANTWRLNGLGYTFPPGVTLPAGGLLLLASTNESAFRAQYEVPPNVLFFQYSGQLQDSGERLELQRPGIPDTNGVPYVTVDWVRYNDRAPWPPAADGSGPSLQKRPLAAYGNDPAHWFASSPAPGTSELDSDMDEDGLPDDWETANGTNPLVHDAEADLDGDGQTNREEYLAGTSPGDPLSRLRIETVTINGSQVQLRFMAVAQRSYRVLYKETLGATAWTKLVDVPATAGTRMESVVDALPSNGTRFYRLVIPSEP
jgi:hypothetical protein